MSESLDNFVRGALQRRDDGDLPTVATGPPVRSSPAAVPGTLPGHVVEDFIARGGMGAVYRAQQVALGREVAVKVMTRDAESPEMAERFRREALVLGRLEHPNIVPIHDMGADADGQLFYTMKLVKGRTLQHILRDLRLEHPDTLRDHHLPALLTIFRKVCDAIAFAHSQGIIHRDLKPDNVMVGEFGEVLVMDWGLAKIQDYETRRQGDAESPDSDISLSHSLMVSPSQTVAGAVMGTPQYMSPEQAWGQIDELDARSDIFSLGGILYAILTLRPPVEGTTLEEVLEKVRTGAITAPTAFGSATASKGKAVPKGEVLEARKVTPLPHITGGRVPAALSAVAMKALRVEKADRYQSVADLSADIEAYQGGFATSAEHAGALKQLKLLMLRHKAVTASLAAMVLLSIGFVIKVMASERKATRNAEVATANEKRANASAEEARRSLAQAEIALADAAFRNADAGAMARSLNLCPEDLRDQSWHYLSARLDASHHALTIGTLPGLRMVEPVSGQPGCFVMSGDSKEVWLVNVEQDRVLKKIPVARQGLKSVAVSGDGRWLAVTGEEARVQWFDLQTGALVRELTSPFPVNAMAIDRDGARLVVSGFIERSNPGLAMLNVADGGLLWRAPGFANRLAFTPDGTRLLCGSDGLNRTFTLVESAGGKVISKTELDTFSMAVSGDGRLIALGSHFGELVVLDGLTGTVLTRSQPYGSRVVYLAFTRDNRILCVANKWKMGNMRWVIQLWEPATLVPVATFLGLKRTQHPPCALHPDGGAFVSAQGPGYVWHLPVAKEIARMPHRAEQAWGGLFLDDTTLLARKEFDMMTYDLSDPARPVERGKRRAFTTADMHLPSKIVVCNGTASGDPRRADHGFAIFSYDRGELTLKRTILFGPGGATRPVLNPEGKTLAGLTPYGKLELFDVETGASLQKFPGSFTKAAFTGPDTLIALPQSQGTDDKLVVFDCKTGAEIRQAAFPFRISGMAVSPDLKQLVVGGSDWKIHRLDPATLAEISAFRAHDSDVTALAFHPTRPAVLASGSADLSVKLWDHAAARMERQFIGLGGPPIVLAFNPSGKLLLVDGHEHTTRLFDVSGK